MLLTQRFNYFQPQQFQGSASGAANSPLLGTTQKWQIDRTWPIEEILLHVNFTVNTGGLTLATSPTSPDAYDNVLTLLQHINLSTNDGRQPRSVVDCNGVALLEYATLTSLNLDLGTQTVIAYSTGATLPAGNYTLTYRVPMVEPWIGEPLRTRMYLPVHLYPQDPVLTLSFQQGSQMYSAGNINYVGVEVELLRRQPTIQSEAFLRADAQKRGLTNPSGYIDFDLIETPFSIAPGIGTEQRFPIPIPGEYANLMFRHYQGGAAVTRKEIDNGATGSSFGNENRWRLETGSVVQREWKWKQLRNICEMSKPVQQLISPSVFVAASSGGAVTTALAQPLAGIVGGGIPSGQGFRYANSTMLNFLTDGISGDNATELGSLLDCNTPANTGLKMEIIGTPASVATNASYLYVMGRRYFGNLAGWSAFA